MHGKAVYKELRIGGWGGGSNGSEYNSASCAASAIPLSVSTGIVTTTRVGIHGHC